ncbi:MAG: hypothetical protein WC962_10700 [Phycisphaerae bacterium]|jgi:hypothetical protein
MAKTKITVLSEYLFGRANDKHNSMDNISMGKHIVRQCAELALALEKRVEELQEEKNKAYREGYNDGMDACGDGTGERI